MASVTKEDYFTFIEDTYEILDLIEILNIDVKDIIDKFDKEILDNKELLRECLERR